MVLPDLFAHRYNKVIYCLQGRGANDEKMSKGLITNTKL
jgi:hypothetical protein